MITDSKTMEMTDTPAAEAGKSTDVADYPSHEDRKCEVDEYLANTVDARALGDKCRDYKDGKQWTEEQIATLKSRKQAAIVNNRIKVKHNGLLGLMLIRKGDPKAFPRNVSMQDSGAAEAATDGLRYAADNTTLNQVFTENADAYFCEGVTGSHIVVGQMPNGDVEVQIDSVLPNRVFYDVHSVKHDFRDARFKGFVMWMDENDINIENYPDADPEALSPPKEVGGEWDFEDEPSWYVKEGKYCRHLVATHYYLQKGVWMVCVYTGSGYLVPPMPSPYKDKYGQPECALELEHAYIDRENNRYGELVSSLDLQDEINHRRSKGLFLLSQRQTFGNRGAINDIRKAKRELAKGDGHLEVGQGEFGKDFGILPTGDMAQGQLQLLQESKAEIDGQSYNAQLSGERQSGDLSGLAIGKLQQAGVTELNILFEQFSAFKLRVYRQAWNRIRQFWDQEKWVRVTDDQKKARFVGFNIPVTMAEFLQEVMEDESKPREMRLGASAQLIMLEQTNPQALQEVVMTKNNPAEMDMDIIIDESYDVINASQEQLDAILKFGAQQGFDLVDLLEISNITGKDRLIEKLKRRREEAAAAGSQDPKIIESQAKAQDTLAAAKKKEAETAQTIIETSMLEKNPDVQFKGLVRT